jgi:predicted small secreted protein
MTNSTKLKTKFLSFLRRYGMLCKKYIKTTKRIRISKTVFPNGEEIIHPNYITKAPENLHSFESELHVYHEIRKSILKK